MSDIRKFVSTAGNGLEPRSFAFVTNLEKFQRCEGDRWREVEFDPETERTRISYDVIEQAACESGFAIVHIL